MSIPFKRSDWKQGGWVTFNVRAEDAQAAEQALQGSDLEHATLQIKLGGALEALDTVIASRQALAERASAMAHDLQAVDQLLAVIHRDGGHYQAEFGRAQAIRDAMRIVAELQAGGEA
jgi:hypothetical protein